MIPCVILLKMMSLEPNISEKIVSFGYVRTQRTGLMKIFTMPSDYKYTSRDEVTKQFQEDALEAARPAPAAHPAHCLPKQLAVFSFFVGNSNQHYMLPIADCCG